MISKLMPYITLVCTSSVLNLYLCLYVFLKRHKYTNIAYLFILYTLTLTIYCLATAFCLMSTTIEEIKFWTIIGYVGMPFSPPLGLMFVMHYLGIPLTKKKCAALLIIPFITLIMVATNDFHHLYYRVYEIDPVLGAPYVHEEIGIWYMIQGLFTFATMFVAFLLGLFHWKETAREYKPQLFTLLCGQLVPMLTAFFYLIGATPPGFDPVPMVLWLSSLLYLWSINSSRLFKIMPIAKDVIFNSINDGVMVLDESNRLIEFNRSCQQMFPSLNSKMYGMGVASVWKKLSGTVLPFQIKEAPEKQEFQFLADNQAEYTYQVRISPVQHNRSISGFLLIFTDITELKNLQLKLEHQAYHDELTQIFNRRAFFQQCTQSFEEAKRANTPYSVILIDVDYFKRINDTYGHDVGDRVLVHIAQVCQSQLVGGALFARYGGEEFVFGLKGFTGAEAEAFANQLRHAIGTQPIVVNHEVIKVTLSLGVAEATGDHEETLFDLLNNADKMLYKAKEEGRNRVYVFS
ncbi:diguanylate cyclase [Pullulanibacillus sp. KACC 23026]|uniref:histidine kinase N-terminal 7TM domain-containing diguanylate cyclase n=1 Tax=Pullulanibacillus sp. KACC 23026 TaxID=3028315 RepID=UPI0023B10FD9|nr:diguanylate cyclase [Pullulanibacillus sp. KACC 23026]WEG11896.1 diguanylate cyclase [Pullulanibacillus sp. KACC 23026]